MFRAIRSVSRHPAPAPEPLNPLPDNAVLSLHRAIHRAELTPAVTPGEQVHAGQLIADGPVSCLHAPFDATVTAASPDAVHLQRTGGNTPPVNPHSPPPLADWPEFMRQSGLAGMGGSMFPYARKSRAAIDAKVHTLVVNGVECEPGVEIDEGILCHQHDLFLEGVNAVTKAFNISRRVVAVRKSASKRMAQALAQDGFELLVMPDTYPGGAGKLIVGKLLGRIPGTGIHNSALGCLVMCSTSLWALGRFIREGRPSIDRPLTIVAPGMTSRNMIVPIGTPISHILQTCNVPYDSTQHLLVAQGRMMGQAVTPDYTILKGSISLAVIPRTRRLFRREDPCILCGSCFDACPLHLHPIGMADRIREDRFTPSLTTQLNECFLCGACSAVCPSDIPLAEIFRKGKVCLKQTQKP